MVQLKPYWKSWARNKYRLGISCTGLRHVAGAWKRWSADDYHGRGFDEDSGSRSPRRRYYSLRHAASTSLYALPRTSCSRRSQGAVPASLLEFVDSNRIQSAQAGMWVVPAETSKNRDVFEEPTGMYSRRVSAGTTRSAAVVWHLPYRSPDLRRGDRLPPTSRRPQKRAPIEPHSS